MSFIEDERIEDYNRREALETLRFFIDKNDQKVKRLLKKISERDPVSDLGKTANALLITTYRDEEAIDWRFQRLKEPIEFTGFQKEFHAVGPAEEELTSTTFARPLINLQDSRYLPKFLGLLQFSINFTEKNSDKKFREYINYLWRIIFAYLELLKSKKTFNFLKVVEAYINTINDKRHLNWLKRRFDEIKKIYINEIGKDSKPKLNKTTSFINFVDKEVKSTKNIKEKVISASDVGVYKEESKQQKVDPTKKIDFFISHATKKEFGEEDFVRNLREILGGNPYNYGVFLDMEDNRGRDRHKINTNLAQSKRAIFVCTNGYRQKFSEKDADGFDSMIVNEVNYYDQQRISKDSSSAILVTLGIKRNEAVESIPAFVRLFCISVEFPPTKLTILEAAADTASKIAQRIRE